MENENKSTEKNTGQAEGAKVKHSSDKMQEVKPAPKKQAHKSGKPARGNKPNGKRQNRDEAKVQYKKPDLSKLLEKGRNSGTVTNSEDMALFHEAVGKKGDITNPDRGSKYTGTVVNVTEDRIFIDFGFKSEGMADRAEFPDAKKGDEITARYIGSENGAPMYSNKPTDSSSMIKELKNNVDSGAPVSVKITRKMDNGFIGKVNMLDVFIPFNHIPQELKDEADLIGRSMLAKVLKAIPGKSSSVIVSPREHLKHEDSKKRLEYLEKLNVGDVVSGVVKTLESYAAFVNLGAIDAFLHRDEIEWGRSVSPKDFLKVDEKLKVIVTDIDRENGKISVSLKRITEDPWESVETKYPDAKEVSATIIDKRRGGFLAEVEAGIMAFIPDEELSWVRNARIHLKRGDKVSAKVIGYDFDRKRIMLSVKDLQANPWEELLKNYAEGDEVEGTIKNITDFGLFIDFNAGVDGLVRKSDISWDEEKCNTSSYHSGDKIKAKLLSIDPERQRISLSIKHLEANPWRDAARSLTPGKHVQATITAITKQGLEVEFSGLTATIAVNDLDPEKPSTEEYNVGDTVDAAVLKADLREKSITLSIKKYIQEAERKEAKKYMKQLEGEDDSSFGNVFKDKLS